MLRPMLEGSRFAEARRRLDEVAHRERAEPDLAADNAARAWLHSGPTQRAVVLLHGLTNSPQQYALLGEPHFEDGHSVIAPRFPYHGYSDRMTNALENLTLDDLLTSSLEAVSIAALLAPRVAVMGVSVGGTIAAWLALKVSVEHVIAVAPFFGIIYAPAAVSDGLAAAFMRLANTYVWWDPLHQIDQLPKHAYPRFSTLALARALGLSAGFEATAPGEEHARCLTLVLNSSDPIVNNGLASQRAHAKERGDFKVDDVVIEGLPHLHDIIEPTLPRAPTEKVYPVLRRLVNGVRPELLDPIEHPPLEE